MKMILNKEIAQTILSKQNGQGVVVIPQGFTEIDYRAFSHCEQIIEITIPEGVERIGEKAFFMCKNLRRVNFPESLISIADFAFAACKALGYADIPDNVCTIGKKAFSGCPALRKIRVPYGTEIADNAFLYSRYPEVKRYEVMEDYWDINMPETE